MKRSNQDQDFVEAQGQSEAIDFGQGRRKPGHCAELQKPVVKMRQGWLYARLRGQRMEKWENRAILFFQ
jgi:hypothetical protein